FREAILVCGKEGFTYKGATKRMLALSVLASASIYTYYSALMFTSSTDVTAIYSSATAFVYVLSLIWLKETFVVLRMLAVLLSIVGVVLVAYSEGLGSFAALGVLLTAVSALFAAFFRVLVKRIVAGPSISQTAMLLSIVGFYTLITLWIPTLILHCTGVQVLSAASFPWPFFLMIFFHALYDLLLCIGIAITYPVYASMGPLFAIPMNAAIDVSYRQEVFNIYKILGTVLLMVAFIILSIPIPKMIAFSAKVRKIVTFRSCRQ
ncbi:uncharacterized protein TRIADDRAFT_31648, partial [Trichoplax adhaerens]